MIATTDGTSTVWLCGCCMALLANGDTSGHDYWCGDEPAPLSLLASFGAVGEITCGMIADEHTCGFERGDRSAWENGACHCEQRDFTWSPCDGCGTGGGSRDAATLWSS